VGGDKVAEGIPKGKSLFQKGKNGVTFNNHEHRKGPHNSATPPQRKTGEAHSAKMF